MNKDTVEHSSDATDLLCIGSPIEGDCIIVSDKTALPLRCIKTNQALSEAEYGTHTLGWISPMINVLIFASLFLWFICYHVFRKECRLKFGMSASIRARYRWRKIIRWLGFVLGCYLVSVLSFTAEKFEIVFFGGFVLIVRSIAFLIMGTSPLKIIKHNDDLFWMRGCGPEYLAGLESQLYETQLSET